MTIERSVILFTRHGQKPTDKGSDVDEITPESMGRVYQNTGVPLADYGFTPNQAKLRRSDKERTEDTGLSILTGAFGMPVPTSREDLISRDFRSKGVEVETDPRLGYTGFNFNMGELKNGMTAYIDWMLANPDATEMQGVEVTPYSTALEAGKGVLVDALGRALTEKPTLEVVASHASRIETPVIAAINSGRLVPVKTFDDIGGQFPEEGYAVLNVDYNPATGAHYAELFRDGTHYAIDIANAMDKQSF